MEDMTGKLGEILRICIMPDENRFVRRSEKTALMSHHSRVNFPKLSVIMKLRKPLD